MMEANPDKFQVILLCRSAAVHDFNIVINDITLHGEPYVKLLGIYIDQQMNYSFHVKQLCLKTSRQLGALNRIRHILEPDSKLALLQAFIVSNFNYCPLIWNFCSKESSFKMECILKRALRFVYNDLESEYDVLLAKANMDSLHLSRQKLFAIECYKILNNLLPSYLFDLNNVNTNKTRQNGRLILPRVTTTYHGLPTIKFHMAKVWNSLPAQTTEQTTLAGFKKTLKNWQGLRCNCSLC